MKKNFSNEILEAKIKEAKSQILKYSLSDELSSINNLTKWIVIWKGDEAIHLEEIK